VQKAHRAAAQFARVFRVGGQVDAPCQGLVDPGGVVIDPQEVDRPIGGAPLPSISVAPRMTSLS